MRKISGISLIPINSILFLLGCIALTSFAIVSVNSSGNDKIVTDSCQFLGTTLRLIQEGNSAYLEAEDPSRKLTGKLKITPPCYFLRFEGKLETYAYKNIGIQGVIMVIGKMADVELKNTSVPLKMRYAARKIKVFYSRKSRSCLPTELVQVVYFVKIMELTRKNIGILHTVSSSFSLLECTVLMSFSYILI